jgi:hypothetical protein
LQNVRSAGAVYSDSNGFFALPYRQPKGVIRYSPHHFSPIRPPFGRGVLIPR